MKIRREEIDGEQVIITPCSDCIFYNHYPTPSCTFGRIKKYEKLDKLIRVDDEKVEIKTFCNYARPSSWQKIDDNIQDCVIRVKKDNEIKYDLVARIKTHEDIPKVKAFLESSNPPKRVIFSFETDRIKEIIEEADKLECTFELIKIEDVDATEECEFKRIESPWYQIVDLTKDFSTDIVSQLSYMINEELNPIVAVICDQPVVMTMMAVCVDTSGIRPTVQNILELAKLQDQLDFIRGFNGKSICDYCES